MFLLLHIWKLIVPIRLVSNLHVQLLLLLQCSHVFYMKHFYLYVVFRLASDSKSWLIPYYGHCWDAWKCNRYSNLLLPCQKNRVFLVDSEHDSVELLNICDSYFELLSVWYGTGIHWDVSLWLFHGTLDIIKLLMLWQLTVTSCPRTAVCAVNLVLFFSS